MSPSVTAQLPCPASGFTFPSTAFEDAFFRSGVLDWLVGFPRARLCFRSTSVCVQSLSSTERSQVSNERKYHGPFMNHENLNLLIKKVKASSYIAQYPVLMTVQSALHFNSLTNLFIQTPARLLWEASSHMLQLMREGCSYTYPPLSITRYSFMQPTELDQCRVKKLAKVLTPQNRIRTGFLVIENPKVYPRAIALYKRSINVRIQFIVIK